MKQKCGWVSGIDRSAMKLRMEGISDELNFIRDNPEQDVFDRWDIPTGRLEEYLHMQA
jgi:hypothetical protein